MRYSDSLLIAIFLTLFTFLLVALTTDMSPGSALLAWGDNLTRLNAFIAQIALILVVTHILANTATVARIVESAARLPSTDVQAYAAVTLIAGFASLISGALGLIVGAIAALNIARQMKARQKPVHYPLLAASAYTGFVIWHMGLNGVAPLFMAAADHEMMAITGRAIPLAQTMFSWWNMGLAGLVLVSVAVLCVRMRPAGAAISEITEEQLARTRSVSTAEDIEPGRYTTVPTRALACLFFAYLLFSIVINGAGIDFNSIIWLFMGSGLLLVRGTQEYTKLASNAITSVAPLLIQYPLYAGLMGLLSDSGIVATISASVGNFATQSTLPLLTFLSAGLVNFFIPGGGTQWVIQGPIFLEAANALNVSHPLIIMAVAYGDQWTNMIQPFWALPLLGIVGLNIADIFHYMLRVFVLSGVIFAAGLFLLGLMGG